MLLLFKEKKKNKERERVRKYVELDEELGCEIISRVENRV
jgi:hypothetical protein